MGQRENERDGGLGVVYQNLDAHVPAAGRRPRRAGRRTGMVAAVLLTAALIAAPAIVYAGMLPDAPGRVVPAGLTTASPTPTAEATPTPAAEADPGPIGVGELRGFALPEVPEGWTCPAAGVTVVDSPSLGKVWATAITHGDLDGDGAQDAVVVLRCVLKESAGPEAAVAFTRLGADVVPLGVVTMTTGTTVQWLTAARIADDGTVVVTVGDLQPYADQPAEWTRYLDQQFWYVGNGEFGGSSVSFSPLLNPSARPRADLWVRSGNLTYDATGEGTISITVGNRGPVVADDVWLSLDPGGPLAAREQGWDACLELRTAAPWAVPPEQGRSVPLTGGAAPSESPVSLSGFPVQCRLGNVGAGEEVTLLLVVRKGGDAAPGGSVVAYRRALGGAPVPDDDPADDLATFAVR
ncbi:hypothetical protein [Catenuloplanes atrovinosus]|uniref:Uncharacterized protein n=1 Tax=Catenuloplanes atrovinosus TaxID=137266 RepID=A0AAE3YP59_9ACTN|nr:hypothetical protein [Catenuloplanes atrovinosus]MDR7275838.1 hypothetical protein [Catenuloplanes atrovinosus]